MQGIVDVTVLNLNVCECMHICILTTHVLLISIVKDDRTLPTFCQHNSVLVQDLTVAFQFTYVGHLESKERLHIQPAQLFNFS